MQVLETSKTTLGEDHPRTLNSMASLAFTYWRQVQWKEVELLFVQVMERRMTKLRADHPDMLTSALRNEET